MMKTPNIQLKQLAIFFFALLILNSCNFSGHGGLKSNSKKDDKSVPPNILLILVDDMGFSDLGSFGSEIDTNTLDALALNGARFRQFYATPACSTTRAQLLSGSDNHLAGVGNMYELLQDYQMGQPGYEGYLNDSVHWMPQRLKENGYFTSMSGKWHLGDEKDVSPQARGFEKSFALLGGSANYYNANVAINAMGKAAYREDNKFIFRPDGQYASDLYTDKLLHYLTSEESRDKPFFAYLAFTAPHFPIQAPPEYVQKYANLYDRGYQQIRKNRLQRTTELKMFTPEELSSSLVSNDIKAWDSLPPETQNLEARRMQVHAAMIDNIDDNVERITDLLSKDGRLENTIIVFLSDNGADAKNLTKHPLFAPRREAANNHLDNIGNATSYEAIGPNWARVSNTPFGGVKQYPREGGMRVPAFIWWGENVPPTGRMRGEIVNDIATVRDLLPTFLKQAGVDLNQLPTNAPQKHTLTGNDLLSASSTSHELVKGWEHRNRYALLKDKWKLVRIPNRKGIARWELFNLEVDLAETMDVSASHPEIMKSMLPHWEDYVEQNNVRLPDGDHIEVMPPHMFNVGIFDKETAIAR